MRGFIPTFIWVIISWMIFTSFLIKSIKYQMLQITDIYYMRDIFTRTFHLKDNLQRTKWGGHFARRTKRRGNFVKDVLRRTFLTVPSQSTRCWFSLTCLTKADFEHDTQLGDVVKTLYSLSPQYCLDQELLCILYLRVEINIAKFDSLLSSHPLPHVPWTFGTLV